MREVNFEKLTKRAIATYTQERAALVDGSAEALRLAEQSKAELLTDLAAAEAMIGAASTSHAAVDVKAQLASLHSIIARRTSENDQLARANHTSTRSDWAGG